jgi:tetratricopeptide (TPR) repeat protein
MSSGCIARTANHRRRILLGVVTLGITCSGILTVAQSDPTNLRNPSSGTVSANQLLSSGKALRSVARARKFLVEGRIDKAQKEIANALHESPSCAAAIDIQGAIYLRTGRLDDAADEFQKAIDADSTIGQGYVGLGIILISQHRYKEALVPLDRAASLLPSSWIVHFETATAYLLLGDIEATRKQIGYAKQFEGTDPNKRSGTAYMQALFLIHLQQFADATRFMEDAIRFDPTGSYAAPARAEIAQMKPLLEASIRPLEPGPQP